MSLCALEKEVRNESFGLFLCLFIRKMAKLFTFICIYAKNVVPLRTFYVYICFKYDYLWKTIWHS